MDGVGWLLAVVRKRDRCADFGWVIQVERRKSDEPGGEGLLDGVSGCELCLCLLAGEWECAVG